MKLAVISDIHANLTALNLVLDDAKEKGIDKYLFLGDYITDGEYSNEVLDIVKKHADYLVVGNREKYILNYESTKSEYKNIQALKYTFDTLTKENMDYITTLKDHILIEIENTKILMIHGDKYWTNKNELFIFFDKIIKNYDFDICLYGHVHKYMDIIYKGKRFICPGSAGIPDDSNTYKYCIIDINKENVGVELKEISTEVSYDNLIKDYKDTNFYKLNPEWGNLIITGIKQGKYLCKTFIDLLKTKTEDINSLNSKEYNELWDNVYKEFMKEK